jgi:hypothetical protein
VKGLSKAPFSVFPHATMAGHGIMIGDGGTLNVVLTFEDATLFALARNALEIMARRKWGVVHFPSGWGIAFPDIELPAYLNAEKEYRQLRSMRWQDPFAAITESEKWYVEHIHGRQN